MELTAYKMRLMLEQELHVLGIEGYVYAKLGLDRSVFLGGLPGCCCCCCCAAAVYAALAAAAAAV
jgi:hypothetical protein